MPTLKMSVPHQLSEDEAQKRIKDLLVRLQDEHQDKLSDVSVEWDNENCRFQFKAKGFHIAGGIQILPSMVDIEAKVPLVVSFFQQKIRDVIESRAEEVLS